MQVEREIDSVARVLILRVSGEVADGDLLGLGDRIASTPGLTPDFSLLIDLREADGHQVSSNGVRVLAAGPILLSPTSRRAVVVPTQLGFGLARMYEMLREGQGTVRAFRDYAEARRWVAASGP